jgi:peroxiredoxin
MVIEQGRAAPLPEGSVVDAEGSEHDLRQMVETGPVLLGIYKSSCASSKQMFPFLERIHQRFGEQGLQVVGVSQDSENITRSFARRYGITFPIIVEGPEYPISRAFDIAATPTIFLITPDQTVAYTTMGFMKPALDLIGDAAADAVGAAHETLLTPADETVPMFVPG